jgi:O-antigen ligase
VTTASSYIVIYLLFLLQFIYLPVGISFFETPKVYFAQLGIFILLLLAVLRSQTPTLKQITKPHLIAFGGIIAISVIHLLFYQTETSFFGNVYRLQGILLLWMLILWAILSSRIPIMKLLHPYFVFGCLVVQLIASLLISGEELTRAIGSIGEPNALAAVVIGVWPFLYFSKRPVPAWIKYGAMLIVFIIIYMSGSRSGMIAFVLQMVFVLLRMVNMSFAKAAVTSLLILILTYSLPFLPQGSLYEQRSEIWQAAYMAGLEKPILGNGFGNTEFALQQSINASDNNLRGSFVDSSHNIFLDWWVQGGVVGLGIFVFLIFTALINFIKRQKPMKLILLLGLLAVLSFNPASIVSLIALWWLIGKTFLPEQTGVEEQK